MSWKMTFTLQFVIWVFIMFSSGYCKAVSVSDKETIGLTGGDTVNGIKDKYQDVNSYKSEYGYSANMMPVLRDRPVHRPTPNYQSSYFIPTLRDVPADLDEDTLTDLPDTDLSTNVSRNVSKSDAKNYSSCEMSVVSEFVEKRMINFSREHIVYRTNQRVSLKVVTDPAEDIQCTVDVYINPSIYGTRDPITSGWKIALTVVLGLLLIFTVLFSILVIRHSQRSSTLNQCSCLLLFFIATSDILTIAFGIQDITYLSIIKSEHFGALPLDSCSIISVLQRLSVVSHTISIWLTVVLSIQRYICIKAPFHANTYITVRRTVALVIVISILSLSIHAFRFVDSSFEPIMISKDIYLEEYLISCRKVYPQWVGDPAVYESLYLWIRVSLDKFIPCIALGTFAIATVRELIRQQKRSSWMRSGTTDMKSRRLSVYIATMACVLFTAEFPAGILLGSIAVSISYQRTIIPYEDATMAALILDMYLYICYFLVFLFYCIMGRRQREVLASCCKVRVGTPSTTVSLNNMNNTASNSDVLE